MKVFRTSRKWTAFLLFMLQLALVGRHEVGGNIENYCFGVPSGSTKTQDTRTIGYGNINSPNWFGITHQNVGLKNFKFQVKVFGIKHNGRALRGWLHVVISFGTEGAAAPQRFAINARGYTSKGFSGGNAGWVSGIGDFNPSFPDCDDEDDSTTTSKFEATQFLPCGGITPFEPTMGWGFVVLANSKNEVHLNFRFSQMLFNFYSKINFRVHGFHDKFEGDKLSYNVVEDSETVTINMNTKQVMGAPDAIPIRQKDTTITCHETLDSEDHPYISSFTSEALGPSKCYDDYSCLPPKESGALYSGRCRNIHSPQGQTESRLDGSVDNAHVYPEGTDLDPSFLDSLTDFEDQIKEIEELIELRCNSAEEGYECPVLPPMPDRYHNETHEILIPFDNSRESSGIALTGGSRAGAADPPTETKDELEDVRQGVRVKKRLTAQIWDARVLHGIFMTIISIFIIPVDWITVRYFKETWMGRTIMFNNYWYYVSANFLYATIVLWSSGSGIICYATTFQYLNSETQMHHFWVGMSFVLYVSGMVRLFTTKFVLGTSLKSERTVHTACGYTSIGIFTLMMFLGGFRPFNRSLRAMTIALHFTLGLVIYVCNLIAVMTSTLIPASPTKAGGRWKFIVISGLLGFRVALDILTHVVLSISLCKSDKLLEMERGRFYFPVPIPVLDNTDFLDLPGGSFRVKVLAAYVTLSFFLTAAFCSVMLIAKFDAHAGYGPMSCTHETELKLLDSLGAACHPQ